MFKTLFHRWHLLSLDAPTVAALWTWFIAHCCGVALPANAVAAMFLAVWMLYAADRLLDARLLDARLPVSPAAAFAELEARHHFHHRHRGAFLAGLVAAAFLLAALLTQLLPEALRLYALLASLLFAWFLLIHTRLAAARRLPKELAVGLFFPAAVFIPTVARHPELRAALLLPALLFAAVCTLNCLFLYAWEHPGERQQAHWSTRLATDHLTPLTSLIAVATLLCIPLRHSAPAAFAMTVAFPVACAMTAMLLLLLHRARARLSPLTLRTAADLALLTPILLLR